MRAVCVCVCAPNVCRSLAALITASGRWAFRLGGGYRVRVIGRQATASEAPLLIVAPHSTFLDALVVHWTALPCLIVRSQDKDRPIFGSKYARRRTHKQTPTQTNKANTPSHHHHHQRFFVYFVICLGLLYLCRFFSGRPFPPVAFFDSFFSVCCCCCCIDARVPCSQS